VPPGYLTGTPVTDIETQVPILITSCSRFNIVWMLSCYPTSSVEALKIVVGNNLTILVMVGLKSCPVPFLRYFDDVGLVMRTESNL